MKQTIEYICGCCNEKRTSEKEYTKYPYDISDCMIVCEKVDNKCLLEVKNPFSGAVYKLDPIEESIYSIIMGSQMIPGYNTNEKLIRGVREGLNWFRTNNAKAYMVLLD